MWRLRAAGGAGRHFLPRPVVIFAGSNKVGDMFGFIFLIYLSIYNHYIIYIYIYFFNLLLFCLAP